MLEKLNFQYIRIINSSSRAVIEICDEINIYDNTEMLKEIMNYKNGSLIWEYEKIP